MFETLERLIGQTIKLVVGAASPKESSYVGVLYHWDADIYYVSYDHDRRRKTFLPGSVVSIIATGSFTVVETR